MSNGSVWFSPVSLLAVQVLVDINWRPVFWGDEFSALAAIKPYASKADIVKMSDEEAEWMFGIPARDALHHPVKASSLICALGRRVISTCSLRITTLPSDDTH